MQNKMSALPQLQLQRVGERPFDYLLRRGDRRERVGSSEVVAPRDVQHLERQLEWLTFEQANVSYSIQQVARLATLHLPPLYAVLV